MPQSRRTLHVSPKVLIELRKLQGTIKSITGQEPSLTELIDELFKQSTFSDLKKQVLSKISNKKSLVKFDGDLI